MEKFDGLLKTATKLDGGIPRDGEEVGGVDVVVGAYGVGTTAVARTDEGVGAKDFGNVVVDAAEDAAGVGDTAADVTEGAAGVHDAAVVVAIVVEAEVVEAVGEGELVASAASGVGDAREDGKAEDADDPIAEASSAAGEVGDALDQVDEGACAAVADATIVGALLIRASASSILRNIRSIRLERASMAADSESVAVEGVEAMALDLVEMKVGLGKKWAEKNKTLIPIVMVLDLQITIARTLRNSGYNFEEESERLEWGTARTGKGSERSQRRKKANAFPFSSLMPFPSVSFSFCMMACTAYIFRPTGLTWQPVYDILPRLKCGLPSSRYC